MFLETANAGGLRKGDVEGGAFSRRAINLYDPAIVVADTLDNREADSQAFAFCRPAKEALIKEGQIGGFDADAGIGD